ncbi:MAG: alpha/beta hydrolase [Chloroflexi bacterium]|nr:alpha/beta hydrolase [Chloroflexota bacterium]
MMTIKALLLDDKDAAIDLDQWREKHEDVVTRLLDTLGQSPVARNTRDIETLGEEKLAAYTCRKIRYVVGEGDSVPAYLLIPHQIKDPIPAVVAMHQIGSGKDEVVGLGGGADFAYGHELATRGYVVLVPDYLAFGERVYPGKDTFDSGPFYEQYPDWSMVGKNVEDSLSAVDVLHTLDVVNRDHIGVIGHSHGGHNAIFAAALDDRVRACASNCGMSVFSEEEERLAWCEDEEGEYAYIPALRPYFLQGQDPPFDLHEVAALIAPRPWLNISAYFDFAYGNQEFLAETGVRLYQVYDLYEQTDAFAYLMHGNNHSFPRYARDLAYAWLDRFLK